jgi:hypothetical protein
MKEKKIFTLEFIPKEDDKTYMGRKLCMLNEMHGMESPHTSDN